MRKLGIIAGLLVLILSFQNCGKSRQDLSLGDSGTQPGITLTYNKIPVDGFRYLTLWDYTHGQFIETELSTGKMIVYEEYGYVRGETYCLPDSVKQELNEIFAGAEICEPKSETRALASDEVCTLEYRYPYASLVSARSEIKLGEKSSGCDEPTDLCGDKALQLKSLVTSALENLSSYSCK